MGSAENRLVRLQDLQHFLAEGSLDDNLQHQATLAAGLLGAGSCSIMLLNSGAPEHLRMTLYARVGNLPDAALTASVGQGEGICGRVLASGDPLLVDDIAQSELAGLAHARDDIGGSLMCAPLRVDGKIVGNKDVRCIEAIQRRQAEYSWSRLAESQFSKRNRIYCNV